MASSSYQDKQTRLKECTKKWRRESKMRRTYAQGSAFPRLHVQETTINHGTSNVTPPSYRDIIVSSRYTRFWEYIQHISTSNHFKCPFCPHDVNRYAQSHKDLPINMDGYETKNKLLDHIVVYHYPFVDKLQCQCHFSTLLNTNMLEHCAKNHDGLSEFKTIVPEVNNKYIPPCIREGMPFTRDTVLETCLTVGPFRFHNRVLTDQEANSVRLLKGIVKMREHRTPTQDGIKKRKIKSGLDTKTPKKVKKQLNPSDRNKRLLVKIVKPNKQPKSSSSANRHNKTEVTGEGSSLRNASGLEDCFSEVAEVQHDIVGVEEKSIDISSPPSMDASDPNPPLQSGTSPMQVVELERSTTEPVKSEPNSSPANCSTSNHDNEPIVIGQLFSLHEIYGDQEDDQQDRQLESRSESVGIETGHSPERDSQLKMFDICTKLITNILSDERIPRKLRYEYFRYVYDAVVDEDLERPNWLVEGP